jgi:hypothetical protein
MPFESDILSMHMAKLEEIQLPWFDQYGVVKDEDFLVRKRKPKIKINNIMRTENTGLVLKVDDKQSGDDIPTEFMPTQHLFCAKNPATVPAVVATDIEKWKRIDADLAIFLQDHQSVDGDMPTVKADDSCATQASPSPPLTGNQLVTEVANSAQDVLAAIMSSGNLFPCQQSAPQQKQDEAKIKPETPGKTITTVISGLEAIAASITPPRQKEAVGVHRRPLDNKHTDAFSWINKMQNYDRIRADKRHRENELELKLAKIQTFQRSRRYRKKPQKVVELPPTSPLLPPKALPFQLPAVFGQGKSANHSIKTSTFNAEFVTNKIPSKNEMDLSSNSTIEIENDEPALNWSFEKEVSQDIACEMIEQTVNKQSKIIIIEDDEPSLEWSFEKEVNQEEKMKPPTTKGQLGESSFTKTYNEDFHRMYKALTQSQTGGANNLDQALSQPLPKECDFDEISVCLVGTDTKNYHGLNQQIDKKSSRTELQSIIKSIESNATRNKQQEKFPMLPSYNALSTTQENFNQIKERQDKSKQEIALGSTVSFHSTPTKEAAQHMVTQQSQTETINAAGMLVTTTGQQCITNSPQVQNAEKPASELHMEEFLGNNLKDDNANLQTLMLGAQTQATVPTQSTDLNEIVGEGQVKVTTRTHTEQNTRHIQATEESRDQQVISSTGKDTKITPAFTPQLAVSTGQKDHNNEVTPNTYTAHDAIKEVDLKSKIVDQVLTPLALAGQGDNNILEIKHHFHLPKANGFKESNFGDKLLAAGDGILTKTPPERNTSRLQAPTTTKDFTVKSALKCQNSGNLSPTDRMVDINKVTTTMKASPGPDFQRHPIVNIKEDAQQLSTIHKYDQQIQKVTRMEENHASDTKQEHKSTGNKQKDVQPSSERQTDQYRHTIVTKVQPEVLQKGKQQQTKRYFEATVKRVETNDIKQQQIEQQQQQAQQPKRYFGTIIKRVKTEKVPVAPVSEDQKFQQTPSWVDMVKKNNRGGKEKGNFQSMERQRKQKAPTSAPKFSNTKVKDVKPSPTTKKSLEIHKNPEDLMKTAVKCTKSSFNGDVKKPRKLELFKLPGADYVKPSLRRRRKQGKQGITKTTKPSSCIFLPRPKRNFDDLKPYFAPKGKLRHVAPSSAQKKPKNMPALTSKTEGKGGFTNSQNKSKTRLPQCERPKRGTMDPPKTIPKPTDIRKQPQQNITSLTTQQQLRRAREIRIRAEMEHRRRTGQTFFTKEEHLLAAQRAKPDDGLAEFINAIEMDWRPCGLPSVIQQPPLTLSDRARMRAAAAAAKAMPSNIVNNEAIKDSNNYNESKEDKFNHSSSVSGKRKTLPEGSSSSVSKAPRLQDETTTRTHHTTRHFSKTSSADRRSRRSPSPYRTLPRRYDGRYRNQPRSQYRQRNDKHRKTSRNTSMYQTLNSTNVHQSFKHHSSGRRSPTAIITSKKTSSSHSSCRQQSSTGQNRERKLSPAKISSNTTSSQNNYQQLSNVEQQPSYKPSAAEETLKTKRKITIEEYRRIRGTKRKLEADTKNNDEKSNKDYQPCAKIPNTRRHC